LLSLIASGLDNFVCDCRCVAFRRSVNILLSA